MRKGKKTLVYFAAERAFYKLTSEKELEELLQRCNQEHVHEAQRQIGMKLPAARQLPLHVPQP
jgi:hypothetical protein